MVKEYSTGMAEVKEREESTNKQVVFMGKAAAREFKGYYEYLKNTRFNVDATYETYKQIQHTINKECW